MCRNVGAGDERDHRRFVRALPVYELKIPLQIQANIALETETRELNVPAGLQDRVVQAYQDLVYMDFARALMDARGYGEYERMDVGLLPKIYVAYRTSLRRRYKDIHNDLREQWLRGDAGSSRRNGDVGRLCSKGRACLLQATREARSTGGRELRSARQDLSNEMG